MPVTNNRIELFFVAWLELPLPQRDLLKALLAGLFADVGWLGCD